MESKKLNFHWWQEYRQETNQENDIASERRMWSDYMVKPTKSSVSNIFNNYFIEAALFELSPLWNISAAWFLKLAILWAYFDR